MLARHDFSFLNALDAKGPAADRAEKMHLYGQFIGRWDMDAIMHGEDGSRQTGEGEIHFGWVLEGRAIQDVWVLRQHAAPDTEVFHGTTLRIYDPGLDAWHILWSDPVRQFYSRQLGRADGADIVQIGKDDAGTPRRWRFTEIAPHSFHWLGEISADGGATWRLEVEFFARRGGGR